MKRLLVTAGLAAVASLLALQADATQIATFGQTSGSNTVVATANGAGTQTSLSITNAVVDVTQLFNNSPLNGVDFNLSATSTDAAQSLGSAVIQHYNGSFCITSGPGCSGINFLSGAFADAAFGALGGPGLVVNANNPPDSLTLTSSVISPTDLGAPNSFNLTFSNLTPLLHITGQTIASFSASFGGNASANAIPEPAPFLMLGIGLVGLGLWRRYAQQ